MPDRLNDPEYTARVKEILDELEKTAPLIRRTRRDRWREHIRDLCSLIAVVALVLGISSAVRAGNVGQCVNDALGERSAPTRQENQLNRTFADSLDLFARGNKDAVQLVTLGHVKEGLALLTSVDATFTKATKTYIDGLNAIQAFRDSHPLGKC